MATTIHLGGCECGCAVCARNCDCVTCNQLPKEKESFSYEGTFRFQSDQRLTKEQLDQLSDLIALQIIEPVNLENEEEDYLTSKVTASVGLVLWNCGLCGVEILRARDVHFFNPWGETCLACTDEVRGGQK